jgi:16S rRNA (cytosine967-C5)-methyltransferase
VNAVLRKIVQNKNDLPKPSDTDAVQYISLTTSHPKWLVKRLVKLLGKEEAEAFCRANNDVAPITAQVNTLKTTAEELTAELEESGISVSPHPWVPGCLELSGTGDLMSIPAFRAGKFLVQDGAAR